MKKQIYLLLATIAILFSCSSSDSDPIQETEEVKIYCFLNGFSFEVFPSETVEKAITVGDTFDLFFETSLDTITVTSYNVDMKWVAHNRYRFTPDKLDDIAIIYSAENDKHTIVLTGGFLFKVYKYTYKFTVLENTYTVDVDDADINDRITNELKESHTPALLSSIELEFVTSVHGNFKYVDRIKKDTITGLFLTDENKSVYNIFYDQSEIKLAIEGKVEWSSSTVLSQDLTEEFREKYPTEDISKVEIRSKSNIGIYYEKYN